jgi:hypothetical protein
MLVISRCSLFSEIFTFTVYVYSEMVISKFLSETINVRKDYVEDLRGLRPPWLLTSRHLAEGAYTLGINYRISGEYKNI